MSAGTRAQMAAATVPMHQKEASTSTQKSGTSSSPLDIAILPASSTQLHEQIDSSPSTPIASSTLPANLPNNVPHKVSQEYHTAQKVSPGGATPANEVNNQANIETNNDDNNSSIHDSDYLDLPSDAEQVIIQEAEQHEYENAVPLTVPLTPTGDMYDEQGSLLASLGPSSGLLAPIRKELEGRKCLILDLDETLVHSSFRHIQQADFVIPVQIDFQLHNVYVIKRPGVDEFMRRMGELYEVVVFTASVSKYGDPLLDQLDIHNVVHHRLFRESCYNHQGNFVKNLAVLGRPLQDVIIIDNSPTSYIFHPQHAIPVSSWFSDAHDNELLDMIPFLEDLATSKVADVSMVLDVTL